MKYKYPEPPENILVKVWHNDWSGDVFSILKKVSYSKKHKKKKKNHADWRWCDESGLKVFYSHEVKSWENL